MRRPPGAPASRPGLHPPSPVSAGEGFAAGSRAGSRQDGRCCPASGALSLPGLAPVDWTAPGVAGVDEAGRGCLAGPVVAAAVLFPPGFDVAAHAGLITLGGLDDSKKLSASRREALAPVIKTACQAWAVGFAWPPEIDRVNILRATLRAMHRAVSLLPRRGGVPVRLLIDGSQIIGCCDLPQQAVVDGDALIPTIAAASILAKTTRDRVMLALDRVHPGYGFARHKGYGSAVHREAIARLGPCRQHRLTFRGVLPEPASEQACLPGLAPRT